MPFDWFFLNYFSDDQLSNEMKDYLESTYNIVSTSLDRHLYVKQNKAANIINTVHKNDKKSDELVAIMNEYKTTNNLRDILKYKNELNKLESILFKYFFLIFDSFLISFI